MTDQPTPPLHEQVRTLEADLVMCREQLAQETERAEKAERMATSPGSPLIQQADTYRRILAHSAIYTHTCISPERGSMSDQIIARLDELSAAESERDEWREPDATSPAQLRFVAAVIDELDGVVGLQADEWGPQNLRAMAHHIERLEAAQQQADAEARNVIKQVRPALESIANVLAFSARDWGQARDLAWLWGIVHGWDDEDHEEDSAMPEQARAHGWDDAEVARLRRLHDAFARILDEAERGEGS